MARRSKGGRTKDGRILVRIGEDSRKRLARNAALEKAASDRAIRKQAKKAATRLRRSQREIAKRAMQLARRLARERARDARRAAKRAGNNKPTDDYNREREENAKKKRKKRPFHPRGPYATGKYTSYARRLERSKRLSARQISATSYQVNGRLVITNADGTPISCNCPDFTQVDGSRNWTESAAGPFNPCKHMMTIPLRANIYTNGICRAGLPANNCILDSPPAGTLVRIFNITASQKPISVIVDNLRPPTPGYIGFSHYKFVDALGTELDYIGASSAGYYVTYSKPIR